MPFRTKDQQATVFLHSLAQLDVRSAARHVGGNGDGTRLARLGDDFRLPLVKLGVKYGVADIGSLEHPAEHLRRFDRGGSDKHRLPPLVSLAQVLHDLIELLPATLEHEVVQVLSDAGPVGGNDHNAQPVDVVKFTRFRFRGARHSGQLFVHPEIVLDRDGGVGLGLLLDGNALLGLDRLVEPVAPSAARHQAPRILIHDHDLAALHDVMLVLLVETIGSQELRDGMDALASDLKILLRFFLPTALIIVRGFGIPLDVDVHHGQVGNHEPFRVIRTDQLPALLREIGLLVFLVDDVMEILLELVSPLFVVVRVHFQVEFLEPFADGGILHHPHELAMGGHAPLHLVETGRRLVRLLIRELIRGKGLFRLLRQLVALPELGLEKLHHLGLHIHEGERVVLTHGTRDDKRCSGLVDQDGVRLIDDAEEIILLYLVLHAGSHPVVPKIIKTEFRSRAIGNVALVHFPALGRRHVVLDTTHGQPKILEEGSHPVGIPQGEVIVDRYELAVLAGQGIEIKGAGRDQRLSLTGRHFGNVALVQGHAPDQLHVVMNHFPKDGMVADGDFLATETTSRVLDHRESLRQELIEALTVAMTFHEFLGLGLKLLFAQGLVLLLDPVDLFHHGLALLEVFSVVPALEGVEEAFDGGEWIHLPL